MAPPLERVSVLFPLHKSGCPGRINLRPRNKLGLIRVIEIATAAAAAAEEIYKILQFKLFLGFGEPSSRIIKPIEEILLNFPPAETALSIETRSCIEEKKFENQWMNFLIANSNHGRSQKQNHDSYFCQTKFAAAAARKGNSNSRPSLQVNSIKHSGLKKECANPS